MLANSLTSFGEARTALLEAVRARQELRYALCRKAPSNVRLRIMTSDVFTMNLISDQKWSECHTLLASITPSANTNTPKPKGDTKQKAKVSNRSKTVAHHTPTQPQNTKPAGTQGKKPFVHKKKQSKGSSPSSVPTTVPSSKPTTATSKN